MIIKWALKKKWKLDCLTSHCIHMDTHTGDVTFWKAFAKKKVFKCLFLFATLLTELIHATHKAGKEVLLCGVSEQRSEEKTLWDLQYHHHHPLCYTSMRLHQPKGTRLIWCPGVRSLGTLPRFRSAVISHAYKERLLRERSHSNQQAQWWEPTATGAGDGPVVPRQETVGEPLPPRGTAQVSLAMEETTSDTFARSSDER